MPLVSALGVWRRFAQLGIEVVPFGEIAADSPLEDAVVRCANVYTGEPREIRDVALLALATPRAPHDALAPPLRAAGFEVHLVGDCYAPRTLLTATSDGHRVGLAV